MRDLLNIAAALSDENRVRALLALRGGELCVCQVVELLGLATSTVSKHLSVLHDAGLVAARKQGRWMYYRLPTPAEVSPAARRALRWVESSLEDDATAATDARRLRTICACEPEELCRKQNESKCCSSAPATPAAARWPKRGRRRSKAIG